jgi:hypothetical protein
MNNCIHNITTLNNKHIDVLAVTGSRNRAYDIMIKTIVPMEKPMRRDGHICPLKAVTIFLTEYINSIDMGIPIRTTSQ